ncbi:MAG TPA: hypothetical protein VGI81_03485 [Tepidisphaeraceae bacterium]|jgi:hypothetical protein
MRIAQGKRLRRSAALLAGCLLLSAGAARAADAGPASTPPASAANEAGPPMATKVAGLQYRYNQAQSEAFTAYTASQGKPDAERMKIYQAKMPDPLPYAQKAVELAKQNPKDPATVSALVFAVQLTARGSGSAEGTALQAEAIDQLSRDHLDDAALAAAFPNLMYSGSPAGKKLIRLAADKSASRDVRGSATFWLAQSLKNSADQTGNAQDLAEAKKLYQQVASEFADVKGFQSTLGDEAKANLYEVENLAIGKTAPQIEGKDANGNPLKLSDHRGKVVVLDFWGDW